MQRLKDVFNDQKQTQVIIAGETRMQPLSTHIKSLRSMTGEDLDQVIYRGPDFLNSPPCPFPSSPSQRRAEAIEKRAVELITSSTHTTPEFLSPAEAEETEQGRQLCKTWRILLSRYLNQRAGNIYPISREPLFIRTRSMGSWVKITIEDATAVDPTLLSTHGPNVHPGLADVAEAIDDALDSWNSERSSHPHSEIHFTPKSDVHSGFGRLAEDVDDALDAWRPFMRSSTCDSGRHSRSDSDLTTSSFESGVWGGSPFRWNSPDSPVRSPLRIFTDNNDSISEPGKTSGRRDTQKTGTKPWQIDSDHRSLASRRLWQDGIQGESWRSEDREAKMEKRMDGGERRTRELRHMGGSLPQRSDPENGIRQGNTAA